MIRTCMFVFTFCLHPASNACFYHWSFKIFFRAMFQKGILAISLGGASAHTRLECPQPLSLETGQKNGTYIHSILTTIQWKTILHCNIFYHRETFFL